jgi:glycosyltransferase involved in cell wall biosynthesis
MWSQKIRFMLDNPDVAKRFGRNAREFVEKKFSWKKIAENFLEIIASYNDGL